MSGERPAVTKASAALSALVKPQKTQAELAEKFRVTQQTISNWANGIRRPEPEKMRELEDELGIPMRDWTFPADENDSQAGAAE